MNGPEIIELNPVPELTVLQAQLGEWGNLNYVLICNATKNAILIDPFSGEFWSQHLMQRNLKTITIVLTHSHWDHTKGVNKFLKLNPKTEILIHQLEYERGWEGLETESWTHPPNTFVNFNVGNLNFEVHCTPGHSPGHITLIGHGIVISGDCLFLGRCGRTDLFGGNKYSMWESQMHLFLRLKKLPKEWIVFPGHQYPLNNGENPTYLPLGSVLKNNPAIQKQSFNDFAKLNFLEFDDELSKKAKLKNMKHGEFR